MKTRLVLAVLLGLMVGLGFGAAMSGRSADAQEKSAADLAWDDLAMKEVKAEIAAVEAMLGKAKPTRDPIFSVANGYREATQTPGALRGAVAKLLHAHFGQKMAARGAAQISQIAAESQLRLSAIQVYQNERIIALLEDIKKP